jgi:L-asparaginase II
VAKVGAEGVQAIGIASAGLGIAIKVADGAGRAVLPAALAVLDALGLLDRDAREACAAQARPVLHNARGRAVGRITPCVALDGPESRAWG